MVKISTFFPMNGGDGPYSYAHNSCLQREGVEGAGALINEEIVEKLDLKKLISSSSWNSFNIADIGCSVGPSTFTAVQNIIESVKLKYQIYDLDSEMIEFQVFFNDHALNDFNTLFKSLASDRQYYAVAVPGSFYGRLFPQASLHFIHSSYALHWISGIPNEMLNKNSPAWNKGRVFYTSAPSKVVEAYPTQYSKDIIFFEWSSSRACFWRPHGSFHSMYPKWDPSLALPCLCCFYILGAILADMAHMGLLSEDKVDSFNFPNYFPTPQELKVLIEKNECFSIERMQPLARSKPHVPVLDDQALTLHLRAGWEQVIREHFGSDCIDELFDRLMKKIVESSIFSSFSYTHAVNLFVLLKRKVT